MDNFAFRNLEVLILCYYSLYIFFINSIMIDNVYTE